VLAVFATQSALAQAFSVIYTFSGGSDGNGPTGLIMSPSGNLYGTTSTGGTWRNEPGFGVVYKMDPITGVEKVLTTFTGVLGDGANPVGTLVRDSSGNLYGTTVDGGAHKQGTLYEITPTGEKIGQLVFDGANGGTSFAGLVLDKKGNLYGTTSAGGTTGNGVVFRLHISPRKDTVLYNFTGSGGDGSDPIGALLRDAAGNLYGTTPIGGIYGGACGSKGCGIVFKIEPSGTETVLYSFSGGSDGANPQYATLICDTKGNLYGTASAGGDSNLGVVFKLNKKGKETVLYSFMGGADGASPYSGVIRDQAGNLYGSTLQGGGTGCSDQMGCGTIFKLSTTGGETILHRFTGGSDGAYPWGLLQDAAGDLYGTTGNGGGGNKKICGTEGCGVLFKITP
jgi:uncharacterized repeat protein (TIGR03803 family)